jgi:hypothetical protein
MSNLFLMLFDMKRYRPGEDRTKVYILIIVLPLLKMTVRLLEFPFLNTIILLAILDITICWILYQHVYIKWQIAIILSSTAFMFSIAKVLAG